MRQKVQCNIASSCINGVSSSVPCYSSNIIYWPTDLMLSFTRLNIRLNATAVTLKPVIYSAALKIDFPATLVLG